MAELAASIRTRISIAQQLSKKTHEDIDGYKDAPEYLKCVGRDLQAFYSILGSLASYLSEEDTAVGVLHPANSEINEVLSESVRLFNDIKPIISEFIQDKATGNMSRWYLSGCPWKEKESKSLRDQLSVAKVKLNVAISTANLINTRTSGQCLEIEVRELKKTLTETLTRLERTHNGHEEENPVDSYPRTPRVEQGVDSILTPDKFERSRPPSSGVSTITVANTRRDTTTDKTSSYGSALSTCETAIGDWSGGTQHGNCSQIFVKGLTHRTLVIDMTAISTIDELKESLYNKTGILPDRISLRLDGRTLSWFNPDQLPNNATLLASINARTRLPLDTGEASMDDMDFTRYRLQKLRLDRLDPRTYRELDHILTYWWLHCGLDSLEDLNKNWERLALNQDLSDRARQILSKERNWLTDRAYIADYSCSTS